MFSRSKDANLPHNQSLLETTALPALSKISLESPRPIADDLNSIRDRRLLAGDRVLNFNQGLVRPDPEWIQLTRSWIKEAADIVEPWSMARVSGITQLRESVAEWRQSLWKAPITSNNILITLGANVAWNLVMKAVSDEGDKIGITRPYFFNHYGSIFRHGRNAQFVDLEFNAEVESLSQSHLDILNQEGLKAFLISNPHNPTGIHFPRSALNQLEATCKRLGKWLVLDESYGAFGHCDRDFQTTGNPLDISTTIVVGSLTKSLALGDIRVGYVIAHESVIEKLKGFADDEYITVSQIMQYVAKKAIDQRMIVEGSIKRSLQEKSILINEIVKESKYLQTSTNYNSVFAWIKLPQGIDDVLMAQYLAEQFGVLVTPGSHYGTPGYFRIGYGMCNDDGEIAVALQCIENYLEEKLNLNRRPMIDNSK